MGAQSIESEGRIIVFQIKNLTERVKSVIGGGFQRTPQTLSNIGNYIQKSPAYTPVRNIVAPAAAAVGKSFGNIGEAAYQTSRLATDPVFRTSVLGGDLSKFSTQQLQQSNKRPSLFGNRGNLNWRNPSVAIKEGVLPAAQTFFLAKGLDKPLLTAATAGIGGALGGGIGYAQGGRKEAVNQVTRAIGQAPMTAGLLRYTNPLQGAGVNAATNLVGRMGTSAVLNIGEGILLDKLLGRPTTKTSLLTDGTIGAAFPFIKAGVKAWKGSDAAGIPPPKEVAESKDPYVRDEWGRFAKGMRDKIEDLVGGGKIDPNRPTELVRTSPTKYEIIYKDTGEKVSNAEMSFKIPKELRDVVEKGEDMPQAAAGLEGTNTKGLLPSFEAQQQPSLLSQQPQMPRTGTKINQPYEDIIAQGRKQIGNVKDDPTKNISETAHDFYTQWVDRFHPVVRASGKAKQTLKLKGAELRPEYDPEFLVRRLTGAGGIADYRFKTDLDPIIKQADTLGISKPDLDVYLANKRMAGFGKAGRDIYGVDVNKAKSIVAALEQKYGESIKQIADPLYKYQDQGLKEMVDAGFISSKDAQAMRGANPDYSPLYRIMDDVNDYLGMPTRKLMQGTQPVMRIKGSTRQIQSPLESIIQNTYSQRAAIEKNRVAQSIVNLQNITDMGFKKVAKSAPDTITVWKDGQKQYWQVGPEIADVAKGVNEESMNLILKILQAPASILRQGATGRNPEFMIPNVVRDQLDAGITSKYGYVPFIDYARGLKSMLSNDDVYKKWQQSGAKISIGELSGKKEVATYVSEKVVKRNLRTWLGDVLDVMGKYSEQPTRVGLFKKAYEKTGNELLAGMESRDATVDFARMGSKMKVANSIIPFLNVSVQGFDKLLRSAKARPGKVLTLMGTYAILPQVTTTLYNLQNFPEAYKDIPDYEKESNFIIMKGVNADGTADYFTIPKGNVLPLAANPVQNFIEYAYGQDSESFKEMALNMLSNSLPVLGQGSSVKEILTKTVGENIPQAIKPLAEAVTNKSFYKYDPKRAETRDIVPFYLKDKPAYEQKYEFTPQMYQKLGALLNVSPLILKNTMEGYLAGYTKIPSQVVEMAYKASRGESISPNEKPLLRRFLKQTYPSGNQTDPNEQKVPGVLERLGLAKTVGASEEAQEELPTNIEDLGYVYEESLKKAKSTAEDQKKIRLGVTSFDSDFDREKKVNELREDRKLALDKIKQVQSEYPDEVYDIEVQTYSSEGSATVVDRVKWAYETLSKTTDNVELKSKLDKMYEGNVLTKAVVEELNKKHNLGLTEYVSGGIRKKLSSGGKKGKKGKKVTFSKITTPKIAKINIKFGKLPRPKKTKKPSLSLKSLTSRQNEYRIRA